MFLESSCAKSLFVQIGDTLSNDISRIKIPIIFYTILVKNWYFK